MKFNFKKFGRGVIITPKKKPPLILLDAAANLLGLLYHIFLGLVHSYAWYVLLLQNLFIISSPIYILLPVTTAMVVYYISCYFTQPPFWDNNGEKLSNIWKAFINQARYIFSYEHFKLLSNLIIPSFGIILLLYCIMNSFTPSPADMTLYLAYPMLATLAGIAIIALIYLAFRTFTPAAEENPKSKISAFKTTSYIIFNMLFYTACGILFGAIINLFFNPMFNYHLCGLGSLASWMIVMAFTAAFLSSTLLFYCYEKEFQQQAAEFYDDCKNSRLLPTTLNVLYGAACGAIFAAIIFSIMFAPIIHIAPNIWPQIFEILSQASFYQALSKVSYISAVVSAVFSLLDSAFTINTAQEKSAQDIFNKYIIEYQYNPFAEDSNSRNQKTPTYGYDPVCIT